MQKDMVFTLVLGILIISLLGVAWLQMKSKNTEAVSDKPYISTNINDKSYTLEIASTEAAREKGLMNRAHLDKNTGMLFVFNTTSIYPFWMKNTLIPLDMIWLNEQKEVVYIKENARPCKNVIQAVCSTIVPLKPALYVIELNAGDVKKLNLKVGDKIPFEL